MTQPTRREFLGASALLGTGLVAAIAPRAFAAGDETIKIGLIGCGGRGTGAASQALNTEGPVKLVAMGYAFPANVEGALGHLKGALGDRAEARIDVPPERRFSGFDAYQKVIDSDVDLVVMATPPGFRPVHFEYAVQKGRHVFMEKPVAVDAPGVRQVIAAAKLAKEKNLKVGVGLQRRHQAPYLDIVKRIQDGAIGEIVALRVYWNGGGVWDPRKKRDECKTEMEYQMHNWYYYNWLCGDHIVEQHIHNLDVGLWIKGQLPVKGNGMGGREVRVNPKYGEIFDHHACEFTFPDGSVMFSQCRHIANCWNPVDEFAHGTTGSSHVGHNLTVNGSPQYNVKGGSKDPYQVEHDDLFNAVRKNIEYNEAERGANSSMCAIFGRMLSYSGRELKWEDAINSEISLAPKAYSFDAEPPVKADAAGVYAKAVPGVTKVI